MLKRTHIIDRLVNHQGTIEELFGIFYETLDAERKKILEEEYAMRFKMDSFEEKLKGLLDRTHSYTTTEFFHERFEIQNTIRSMRQTIESFGIYAPKYGVKIVDLSDVKSKLRDFIKNKLASYIEEIDNRFSLENYDYVQNELGNMRIAEIYNQLGPFNYSAYKEEKEGDEDDDRSQGSQENNERVPQYDFIKRKSGAMYRGEVLQHNNRPDGKGFKVFDGQSLYEGFFVDGKCHGYGRGISSKGEVY